MISFSLVIVGNFSTYMYHTSVIHLLTSRLGPFLGLGWWCRNIRKKRLKIAVVGILMLIEV